MVCLRWIYKSEALSDMQDSAAQLSNTFFPSVCLCISGIDLLIYFCLHRWQHSCFQSCHTLDEQDRNCTFTGSYFFFFLFGYFQGSNFLCCVCMSVGFLLVSLFPSLNLRFSSLSFVTESYRTLCYLFTPEMHGVVFIPN